MWQEGDNGCGLCGRRENMVVGGVDYGCGRRERIVMEEGREWLWEEGFNGCGWGARMVVARERGWELGMM